MKSLGQLTAFILTIILSALVTLLGVHIIISIATLYQLNFITQFSFLQILGVVLILQLLKFTYKKTENKEFKDAIEESLTAILSNVFIYLVAWGFAFLYYWILK